ncbi:4222_t:CDS:2, partial [Gigaspora margarita]
QETHPKLANASYKNTIEIYSNLESNILSSKEKIDLKFFLQKMVNKINAEKDISKELIELLKAELNRANMIELDSTITKANDINELGIIDIGKDDT